MIIANPIYDVVFKRLMENERVAKFFISTLLGQTIESLEVKPQEFTYANELAGLAVFRLDFVAIILTESGESKKVLIEIQKAKNRIDLMRFRKYLAEQYKKENRINDEKIALPIITIYILGFKLPEITTACIHVERQYRDMVNNTIIQEKSDFVERLTHDSYVVQVQHISGRYQSRLDKLLSVFEQKNFVQDSKTIKEYLYPTDDKDVETMTAILHHTGTDPKTRQELEREAEAWRSVNAMFEQKEKQLINRLKAKEQELKTQKEELKTKDKELKTQKETLEAQRKLIEELKRKLGDT